MYYKSNDTLGWGEKKCAKYASLKNEEKSPLQQEPGRFQSSWH